jgi:hypothetical protein
MHSALRRLLALGAILTLLAATSCTAPPGGEAASPQPSLTTPAERLEGCVYNLRTIGTALRMYAGDAEGRFPTALSVLAPQYLTRIPTCPAAAKDTYTGGYAASAGAASRGEGAVAAPSALPASGSPSPATGPSGRAAGSAPAAYTVVCAGDHHVEAGLSPNYPQYTSIEGLLPRTLASPSPR